MQVVAQFEEHAPSAAKARIDYKTLTARLKPRPDTNPEFFRGL
jgi:hypothetical protein